MSNLNGLDVGIDYKVKRLNVSDKDVKLQIWDTAGQEKFHQGTIGAPFYRGANGCLLVYDVTNEKSFEQIEQWRDEVFHRIDKAEYFPLVVVGNKIDLGDKRKIGTEEGQKLATELNVHFIETSAKVGINVKNLFKSLA